MVTVVFKEFLGCVPAGVTSHITRLPNQSASTGRWRSHFDSLSALAIVLVLCLSVFAPVARPAELYGVLSATHDSQLQTSLDYGINAIGPGLRLETKRFYVQGNVMYQIKHPPCVRPDGVPADFCSWDRTNYLPWLGHVEFGYRVRLWASNR